MPGRRLCSQHNSYNLLQRDMIVVDENIHDERILKAVAGWYPGQVISITALRPGTIIKDEAIPTLLLQATQPTFVTINVSDFWRRVYAHRGYCIVAISIAKERIAEVPPLLQSLFRHHDLRAKTGRMGKVIRLSPERIEYYGPDWEVHTLL